MSTAPAPKGPGGPRRNPVLWVAAGLIALQAMARGWTALRGFYFAEDFAHLDAAMSHSLLDVEYLTTTSGVHLFPGAMVGAWLTAHLLPLQWVPVVLVVIALQAAVAAGFLRLLLRLFGSHPLILAPLTILTLSPLTLSSTLWWTSALSYLPATLAGVVALCLEVAYLRTGAVSTALKSAAALAVALLFSEQGVLVAVIGLALPWCWFVTGAPFARLRSLLTAYRWITFPYLLVLTAYAALYLWVVPSPFPLPPTPGHEVAALLGDAVVKGLVPALVGGPYTWTPVSPAGALADPTGFAVIATLTVVAATVAATCWVRVRVARAWLVLLVCLVIELAFLVVSGALNFGPAVGLELRHSSWLALPAALMLAVASMPLADGWHRPPREATAPRPAAQPQCERLLARARELGIVGRRAGSGSMAVTLVALGILVPGCLWTQAAYDPWWTHNPARPWVTEAAPVAAALPEGVRLGSTSVPEQVVSPLLSPANESRRILSPVLAEQDVLSGTQSARRLVAFDGQGVLRLAGVAGARGVDPPQDDCGWRLGGRDVSVPLTRTVTETEPVLRLGYVTGGAMTLPATVGDQEVALPIEPGLGAAFVQVPTGVASVTFHASASGNTLCSDDLTVGAVVAIPRTSP